MSGTIPTCVTSCAGNITASTGCSSTDIVCICQDSTYIQSLEPCIIQTCSNSDQQAAVKTLQSICAQAGIPIVFLTLTTPSSTSSASSSNVTHGAQSRTLNSSSTAGIVIGTVIASAIFTGLIAYLFRRYRHKQKARKQIPYDVTYYRPELSGETRKRKVELSSDREIVELETNERRQELHGST